MNSAIPLSDRVLLTAYSFGVLKIKNGLVLQNVTCIFLSFDNMELNVINNVAARSKKKIIVFSIYNPHNNSEINMHPQRISPSRGL